MKLTKEVFKSLEKGDILKGKNGYSAEIILANCGGSGKMTTHLILQSMNDITTNEYIFHNGEEIRYKDVDDKEHDNSIVSGLEGCVFTLIAATS